MRRSDVERTRPKYCCLLILQTALLFTLGSAHELSASDHLFGNGDYCVRISNDHTGPDTVASNAMSTLEIWIANDDLLEGMSASIEITFATAVTWNMFYGDHPPVNEAGRA